MAYFVCSFEGTEHQQLWPINQKKLCPNKDSGRNTCARKKNLYVNIFLVKSSKNWENRETSLIMAMYYYARKLQKGASSSSSSSSSGLARHQSSKVFSNIVFFSWVCKSKKMSMHALIVYIVCLVPLSQVFMQHQDQQEHIFLSLG